MLIFLLFIFFVSVVLHIWGRYRRIGRLVEKIPTEKYPLPFFGNILYFAGNRGHVWNAIREYNKNYSITRIWVGPVMRWIFLKNADDIEIILKSNVNVNKGKAYDLCKFWLKDGLLTSKREKWSQRRKIVNNGFHFNVMKTYVEIMSEHTEDYIKKIQSYGDVSVLNLTDLLLDATLEIICEAAFCVKLANLDSRTVEKYKHSLEDQREILGYRVSRPYITDWMMKYLPIGRKQDRAIKFLHDFTTSVIQKRRVYHEKFNKEQSFQSIVDEITDNVETETENQMHRSKRNLALLDILLLAERDGLIDTEGIKEEVDIFAVAGHETSAVSILIILMLLAEHPEIQKRARAEVTGILNESGGKLEIPEIKKLNYLDRCIKESMRLYPVVPHIMRTIDEDVQLKNYLLPAGVELVVLIYDLHRDPKHWPEPEKFDPDRFLPENVKNRHPFAYIPFSAGPRNCIGKKFGIYETKLMVAKILSEFYLKPIDLTANMKLIINSSLTIDHPIYMKFIRRNVNNVLI